MLNKAKLITVYCCLLVTSCYGSGAELPPGHPLGEMPESFAVSGPSAPGASASSASDAAKQLQINIYRTSGNPALGQNPVAVNPEMTIGELIQEIRVHLGQNVGDIPTIIHDLFLETGGIFNSYSGLYDFPEIRGGRADDAPLEVHNSAPDVCYALLEKNDKTQRLEGALYLGEHQLEPCNLVGDVLKKGDGVTFVISNQKSYVSVPITEHNREELGSDNPSVQIKLSSTAGEALNEVRKIIPKAFEIIGLYEPAVTRNTPAIYLLLQLGNGMLEVPQFFYQMAQCPTVEVPIGFLDRGSSNGIVEDLRDIIEIEGPENCNNLSSASNKLLSEGYALYMGFAHQLLKSTAFKDKLPEYVKGKLCSLRENAILALGMDLGIELLHEYYLTTFYLEGEAIMLNGRSADQESLQNLTRKFGEEITRNENTIMLCLDNREENWGGVIKPTSIADAVTEQLKKLLWIDLPYLQQDDNQEEHD